MNMIHKPHSRRRVATQQRIVTTALTLIDGGGFDALSMAALAHAADYTPGALYRYFKNKDAIVAAVNVRLLDDLAASLSQVADAHPSPLHQIVAMADVWRRLTQQSPGRAELFARMLGDARFHLPMEDAQPVIAAMLAAFAPVAAAFVAAEQAGQVQPGDAAQRSLALFAGLFGAFSLRKQALRAPEYVNSDALAAFVLRSLLTGWGAAAPSLEDAPWW